MDDEPRRTNRKLSITYPRGFVTTRLSTDATQKKSGGLSDDVLNQIVDAIRRHANARRIILYGSRARGDFGRTSDIDIAVECEDGKGFIRNLIDDEVRTLLKLDIVDTARASENLRHEIEEDGIVLYEKA